MFWFRCWRWLAGVGVYLYIWTRFYKLKSQVYRWLWERKFYRIPIRVFDNLEQLPAFMDYGRKWRSDSWLEFFDAVSLPNYAQQVFAGLEPVPKHGLDCDEHAIFLVAAISRSIDAGKLLAENYRNPRFFTVCWMNLDGKADGHNVCMLEVPRGALPAQYAFMDYVDPRGLCDSPDALAQFIVQTYSPGAVVLTWAVQDENLRPLQIRRVPA